MRSAMGRASSGERTTTSPRQSRNVPFGEQLARRVLAPTFALPYNHMEVDVQKLKRLREERVLSQRELAREAGLA